MAKPLFYFACFCLELWLSHWTRPHYHLAPRVAAEVLDELEQTLDGDATLTQEDYTRLQYERFPYPPPHITQAHMLAASLGDLIDFELHPELVLVAPSHLLDINHHVFGGRRDFCKPFRVLVAGGGTGFRTFILASQLADMHAPNYEIVHVDLSSASIAAARARLQSRKALKNAPVRFIRGSILDIPEMDLGKFDYIDCLGVLHHMAEAKAGLQALASVLADGGGMGIMLYGEMGRRGVYELRKVMSLLEVAHGDTKKTFRKRIDRLRGLLQNLPPTNWLRLDSFRWRALQHFLDTNGEAGLVDLFMNPVDDPYNVSMVFDLAESADLAVQTFIPPHALDATSNIQDPSLLEEVLSLSRRDRLSVVELLVGHLDDLSFYLVPTSRSKSTEKDAQPGTAAVVDDGAWDLIPIPVHFNVQHLLEQHRLGVLNMSKPGVPYSYNNLMLRFPLPAVASTILQHVDGKTTLRQIFVRLPVDELLASGDDLEQSTGALGGDERILAAENAFLSVFSRVFRVFHGMSRMYLSSTPISEASLNNVNNYYVRQSERQTEHNMHNYLTFQECDRK